LTVPYFDNKGNISGVIQVVNKKSSVFGADDQGIVELFAKAA